MRALVFGELPDPAPPKPPKELRLVGSNAFGVEEVEGRRQHAIAHYVDLARSS